MERLFNLLGKRIDDPIRHNTLKLAKGHYANFLQRKFNLTVDINHSHPKICTSHIFFCIECNREAKHRETANIDVGVHLQSQEIFHECGKCGNKLEHRSNEETEVWNIDCWSFKWESTIAYS
eukprot:TRINITY_DN1639_c0_g1_i7.p1 TRINITY_DN1639_c0_g1~~TRINITY_DN1639_c0_g1_i7.p1  ORF type:complete len:122 (+),score=22.23 TRINITY_DN1639_c0_g1_i7:631-996(+)